MNFIVIHLRGNGHPSASFPEQHVHSHQWNSLSRDLQIGSKLASDYCGDFIKMGVIHRQKNSDEERETSGTEKISRRRYGFLTQRENDMGLGTSVAPAGKLLSNLAISQREKIAQMWSDFCYNGGKGPLTTNTERRSWIEWQIIRKTQNSSLGNRTVSRLLVIATFLHVWLDLPFWLIIGDFCLNTLRFLHYYDPKTREMIT